MRVFRTIVTAAVGAFLLAVSGCSPSESSPADSSASRTSTTPTATATAVTSSPAQGAQAEVIAFVPTYVRMIDDLYLDPARPLDDIYQVAVAPEATVEVAGIGKFRSLDYQRTGRSRVVAVLAKSVDLTNLPSASPTPAFPTVIVTTCVDVSQVHAVNSTGTSIVPPDRPNYLIEELTVVNLRYPDRASWRVSRAPNRQAQSCDH